MAYKGLASYPNPNRGFLKTPPKFYSNTNKSFGENPNQPADTWDPRPQANAKDAMEIKFKQSEMESKGADEARKNQELKNKQIGEDILYRTITGHSKSDYQSTLQSSTTGYQDPAAKKLTGLKMTPEAYEKSTLEKSEKSPKGDPTVDALDFINSYETNKEIPTGRIVIKDYIPVKETRAITGNDIMNEALKSGRFKGANFNDQRIQKALGDKFATSGETPDDVPTPPQPGQTRIFTDPGSLPSTKGVAEGSFLKTSGVRTHVLRGGQWQPVQ